MKIHNGRNHIYGENFKLKLCMCAQSMALGTRTKLPLEILIRSTISAIHKFWKNILESSLNVSETTARSPASRSPAPRSPVNTFRSPASTSWRTFFRSPASTSRATRSPTLRSLDSDLQLSDPQLLYDQLPLADSQIPKLQISLPHPKTNSFLYQIPILQNSKLCHHNCPIFPHCANNCV